MADMRRLPLLDRIAARIVSIRCLVGAYPPSVKPTGSMFPSGMLPAPPAGNPEPGPSRGPVFSAVEEEASAAPVAARFARGLAHRVAPRRDPVDGAVPVIRDQQCAVAHDFDVDRPT